MSEKTKTDQAVDELLKRYTTIEDMKAHSKEVADKLGFSRGVIYKAIKKIEAKMPSKALPQAQEPIVKIDKPTEVEMPTKQELEEEGLEGEEGLPPSLLEEEKELEEPTPEEKKPPEELAPDRGKRLADIFERSIERILNIPMEGLGLSELTTQELDDSAFLILLLLERHADIQANSEDMLDPVALVHFSSIGARTIVEYLKKRREEQKAKEEEAKRLEPEKAEPTPEPEPEKPVSDQDLARKKSVRPAALTRLGR